jgi:hypothetical protein
MIQLTCFLFFNSLDFDNSPHLTLIIHLTRRRLFDVTPVSLDIVFSYKFMLFTHLTFLAVPQSGGGFALGDASGVVQSMGALVISGMYEQHLST